MKSAQQGQSTRKRRDTHHRHQKRFRLRPDHEKWIREHFPEELPKEDFDFLFWGLYYLEDGLTVMQVGDRRPDEVLYKAKNEEDLKWWLLDFFCYRHADSNVLKHEKT